MADGLHALLSADVLPGRLEALRAIRPETDEARLRRSLANRESFKQRFGIR